MTPDKACEAINRLCDVDGYASFAKRLVGPQDPRVAVAADELLGATMRERIHARFARRFEAFDSRAVHSIWMKWYLNAFIPPVLLADILLGQSVTVALPVTRFVLSDDGRVDAIKIAGTRNSEREEAFQRFQPLISEHFAPLIELWCERTGVTSRVYWSNVGNTFEAMLRRIEEVSGPSPRLAEAQRLLNEPDFLGKPNPLFAAVHYVAENGAAVRLRRVCCLQYLLPDRRFCRACPVEEAREHFRQQGKTP
jgi:ferric iron reductase protein FhuF